jgi:predicted porin
MNKKLMAVAVAGAFVAPALVYAQNATVQVYGRATVEYGYADQGSGRPNQDMFQTPGGSAVGFKGQEQLGGGMSAWFQCESSADVRGLNQDGFCGRNSAIGMKGGWGNVFFGRWDTPFKRATIGMVGAGDTGLLGAAFTAVGNSTGTGASGGTAPFSLNRNVWKRRESTMINYESPSFSGFQILGSYSAANATASTSLATAQKPRVGSIAGTYSNGPLNIALAYEKHYNFGAVGGSNDDRGWTVGASYNFMGNLLVGIQYFDYKYEVTTTTEAKKKNWFLGADWNFSGPHHILGAYVNAGDTKGNATAAQVAAAGLGAGNGALAGNAGAGNTGADFWEIMYGYDFSKRTSVKMGYVKLNNDSSAIYALGGLATTGGAAAPTSVGTNQSAWVFYGQHSW